MLIGWVLLGAGFALWIGSGQVQKVYRRRANQPDPRADVPYAWWVRFLNPLGLVLATVGTIMLIGWMFTLID